MKIRILAFLMIAALLTGLLAGCGDNDADASQMGQNDGGTEQESTLQTEYTYKAEYLEVDVGETYQLDYIDQHCVSGNYLFFSGSCVTDTAARPDEAAEEAAADEETDESQETTVYESLFRMDLDTGETVRLEGYQPPQIPEGQQGDVYTVGMAAGPDGTIWVLDRVNTYSFDLPEGETVPQEEIWDYYVPGESLLSMSQYDTDGQALKSLDLSGMEWVYPQQMLIDQAGNIYINTYDTIYLLDADGTLLTELANDTWGSLCQISATGAGILGYDFESGKQLFRPIDLEMLDYGEETELPFDVKRVYPGFGAYQYFYDDGISVYGCDADTGEAEKLLSWLDCDVSADSFEEFSILADGRIVALTNENAQYELLRMVQVDAATLPQKQELTLACLNLSQGIRSAVINFNRSHDDVRITVLDYSDYNTDENYGLGVTKLNTEILSGNVPDILCTSALPVDQYAAQGILLDLWPLIDGDESLSRDDLMTHLFDVLSTDGKLYRITDSFSIMTVAGSADVIGDRTGWTLEELLEVLETMPEGATIFGDYDTKDGILNSCVNQNIESFINWEDQTCSFDSQEFMDLLNFANTFPAEFDWENYDWETAEGTYSRFMTGMQMLFEVWINDFAYMQLTSAMVGGNPCYVGYPSSNGNGNIFNVAGNTFAITTGCQDIDLAWSFVRTFLTEDYQYHDGALSAYGFPSNRHAFDALVKENMTPEYTTDPETGEQVEVSHSSWAYDDLELDIVAMTQEEYDTFMQLYESCSSVYTNNNTVYGIIQEEAAAFFDGQKTVEETAKLIQDRVGLYVMEQG